MRSIRGFTLVELMVVGALLAILLTLAAPSFTAFFAKKRIEGVAANLLTDLELARSEAVARNALVQVTFGTGCYVIHALPATASASSSATSCSATAVTIGSGEQEIKRFQVASGAPFAVGAGGSLTAILFDPVRGLPRFVPSAAGAAVTVDSTVGGWSLKVQIARNGSTSVCTPDGSVSGVPGCS
ncbi:MAG: GspH/FimT family pseudopilin [Rubrivivax sp.]|nr:GspH/FimT family pseudopilin [Rubrivivax sp.]